MVIVYISYPCFQAVLLELYEGLEDVIWVVLCKIHGLDLLQSLECVEELLYNEDLLCGVSHQWW